jgi:hypothetical protein
VIGKFRKLRVIVLEDSEGEWKALAILGEKEYFKE